MCKATRSAHTSPVRLRPRELHVLCQGAVPPNKKNNCELQVQSVTVKLEIRRPYRKYQRKEVQPCTPSQKKLRTLECPPAPRPHRELRHDLPTPIPENLLIPLLEV